MWRAVVDVIPITTKGRVDTCWQPVTDGVRIFYLERAGDRWNLMQTSMRGGESQPVPTPFSTSTRYFDVSPDRTEVLLGPFRERGVAIPVYTMPLQGGSPLNLGFAAISARWSPKGDLIAFVNGGDLWTASPDGKTRRRLVTRPNIEWISWAPDAQSLRFTSGDPETATPMLWEIGVDGTGLHRVLDGWSTPPSERHGDWSADGRYYVFAAGHAGQFDVWLLRERSTSWRRSPKGPFRLTSGPYTTGGAVMSPDGKRVYFCGQHPSVEMQQVDVASGASTPYLPQIGGRDTEFSADGQWVAYLTATHQLAASRVDGGDEHVITPPGLNVILPRFSADGRTLVFRAQTPGMKAVAYLADRNGGAMTPLVTDGGAVQGADWSPDGRRLVVNSRDPLAPDGHSLGILELASHHVTPLPQSGGLSAPRWSPTGKFIAATSADGSNLMIFDVARARWRRAATVTTFNRAIWSADGRYVYFQDLLSPGEPVFRVRPEGGVPERVADFQSLLKNGANRCELISIAPNGRLVAAVSRSNSDLYAAELQ